MSYLLDKKIQRKKIFKIAWGVFIFIILFYFRAGVWSGLAGITEVVFHPGLVLGGSIGEKFRNVGSYFVSKNYLYNQNQKLQAEVSADDARMANYDSVVSDEADLQATFGRKDAKVNMTLAAILAEPNQSLYDTLLIDAGTLQGIKTGDMVFALGDVPIGRVDLVYDNSAKVILFSNPGEKTEGVVESKIATSPGGNAFMALVGRGGGNFEMVLPKDLVLQTGDQVVMPGINPYVLAIAQTIISDPRDPLNKALLTSPVNMEEQKFVEVAQ